MHDLVFLDNGDRTQAVIEVGEQVGHGVAKLKLGEDDGSIERIEEAVQVDEVHYILVGVLNLGNFAYSYI